MSINMEKRRSKRNSVNLLDAELVYNGTKYPGVIEDICEHGLKVIATSRDCITSFIPENIFQLRCKSHFDNRNHLYCEVRWVHINKTPIHGLIYRMGMEIIDPSPEYKELLSSL